MDHYVNILLSSQNASDFFFLTCSLLYSFATNLQMYCYIMGVCGLRVLFMDNRWQELHISNISVL